jgi:zinc transport system permease protein
VSPVLARTLLLVLLALAIVVTMRLAGVVLATALLVLPGATALRCSARLWPVVGLAVAAGLAGAVGGIVASFELDWPPGPSIVLVQVGLFGAVRVGGSVLSARRG